VAGTAWLLAVAVSSSCGGDDNDDDAVATTDSGALRHCEAVDGGLEYHTALPSCEEARVLGQQLAVETGAAGPSATGKELIYSSVCSAIQQSETQMTADEASIALATGLHEEGVCPGDLGMLIPK
jgi:hypothetical protein